MYFIYEESYISLKINIRLFEINNTFQDICKHYQN